MYQLVTIMGNLGKDAEFKATPSGVSVVNFSVATSANRNVDGEWIQETEWFRCVNFAKELTDKHRRLTKGARIFATGKLKTRSWEGKDGQKKYSTELMVDYFRHLDKSEVPPSQPQASAPNLDDIPF
jgi:single-strand DNA-binding protein